MSEDRIPETDASRPEPGTKVTFRWRKWDGSPHWQHECMYLGSDAWGDWFGQWEGWHSSRPGRELVTRSRNVTLVPPGGEWAYTHNLPPSTTRVYIDVAWDAGWEAGEPVGIDMDLDVVRREPDAPYHDREGVLRAPGDVYIEDRDEWEEHRVRMGYPLEIVRRLEDVAIDLERRVRAGDAPFDEATARGWFARLDALAG